MFKDYINLVIKWIRYRLLRSLLTIAGIILAVFLVVVIFTLGDWIKNNISRFFQMFESDIIVVLPWKETNPLIALIGNQKFKQSDLMDLENIDGIEFVVPRRLSTLNIEHDWEKKTVMIHSAPWEGMRRVLEQSQWIKLEEGKWSQNDNEIIFGYLAFKKLFKNKVEIGDAILIKSKKMYISGYISRTGSPIPDNLVFLPLDVFHNLTWWKGRVWSALIKIDSNANIELVKKQIIHQLSKQDIVRDFSVLTPQKVNIMINNIIEIIELFLLVIALMSLLVWSVGIMNTMYTSVVERTKQIGVMKAIGATNDDILSFFLIESWLIGISGWLLWIILGLISAYFIGVIASNYGFNNLFSFNSIDYYWLFIILIITFTIGIISWVLPAISASRLEASEALRANV